MSFPETLDVAPFMAPNRNDFKVVPTPNGPRAPYQDWPSPEQCPDRQAMPYKLYAVVVHLGTMIGGHYIAYVLVDPERLFAPYGGDPVELMERLALDESERSENPDRRVWCYTSDTEIRLASVQEVMAARAYLCFVRRPETKLTAVREGVLTSHNNLACSITTATTVLQLDTTTDTA